MKYTEEQVLKIVDSCFNMYANHYRTDARDCAREIMKGMINKAPQQANSDNTESEKALPINSVMASALPKFIELLNKGSFFISAIELDMGMDGKDFKQWLIKFVDDIENHLP